jgi:hypothetical protein
MPSFYEASTRNMQERLGALLELLDLERTIVCFVADHGEGFDYDLARVHHGGRLHDDLLRVPLLIRLPESFDPEAPDRLAAPASSPAAAPTSSRRFWSWRGTRPRPESTASSLLALGAQSRAKARREDRRYLYKPNRDRLNVNSAGKEHHALARLKNRLLKRTLVRGFNIKSYVRYPHKLIVTSLALTSGLLPRRCFAPLDSLLLSRDQLLRAGNVVLSWSCSIWRRIPGKRATSSAICGRPASRADRRPGRRLERSRSHRRGQRVALERSPS